MYKTKKNGIERSLSKQVGIDCIESSYTEHICIYVYQDDPASDGDLAFQLSSQPSTSHSQLTVDLPVNILQVTS